jgi:hypothetical protein
MAKLSKIWAGIPGVIYAAFLTIVAVSPEDAQGNVAKWAKVAHIEQWPRWLTDPWAVVIATLFVVAFYVWWWWRRRGQPPKDTPPPPRDGPPNARPPDVPLIDLENSAFDATHTRTKGGQALRAKGSKIKSDDWEHER